jgi:hypothetical protein
MRTWVAGLVLLALAPFAMAQAIPRTTEGKPDFYGVWAANFVPNTLERMPGASGLVVGDDEAKLLADAFWEGRFKNQPVYDPNENLGLARVLPKVNGEWRSSQITDPPDGKAPVTERARQLVGERRARMDARPDGPEARGLIERCIGGLAGAPLVVTPTDNLRQIMQTKDFLVILNETDVGEARVIGIGAAPRPANISQHLGDSVARWEGDTLVVETSNRRTWSGDAARGPAIVVRPEAKVIEQLSLISADELLYRFTIEDKAMYGRPWSAEYSMMRSGQPMFETACHEGNYAMVNMLAAARASERRK